jgi:hypothetical protein
MTCSVDLVWTEVRFSPAQFARLSDLSTEMQRHWRARGLLRARDAFTASFGARDIATVKLMLLFDQPERKRLRPLAERLAPSVLWLVLSNHRTSWVVEGPEQEARAYRRHLEMLGSQPIEFMAGLRSGEFKQYVLVVRGSEPMALRQLRDEFLCGGHERATVIDLKAAASRIAARLGGAPLFRVQLPRPALNGGESHSHK